MSAAVAQQQWHSSSGTAVTGSGSTALSGYNSAALCPQVKSAGIHCERTNTASIALQLAVEDQAAAIS